MHITTLGAHTMPEASMYNQ